MPEFFKHDSFPPSLSNKGKLHAVSKSDLVDILQSKVELPDTKPETDVLKVDGAYLVNKLSPETPKTFENYSRKHVRKDIIFDVYQV